MNKVYIVECTALYGGSDRAYITTTPPRTVQTDVVVTDGWLGIRGKYGYEAHGEYGSESEARAVLRQRFSDHRRVESDDPDVIEVIEASPTLAEVP